jgi:hypothetical protein
VGTATAVGAPTGVDSVHAAVGAASVVTAEGTAVDDLAPDGADAALAGAAATA